MYAVAVAGVVSRDQVRGKQCDNERHFFSAQHSAEMVYYFDQLPVLGLRVAKSRMVATEGTSVNGGSQVGLTWEDISEQVSEDSLIIFEAL